MSEMLVVELFRRGLYDAVPRTIAFASLAFIAEEVFVTLFPIASSSMLAEVPLSIRIGFVIAIAALIFAGSVIQQFTHY